MADNAIYKDIAKRTGGDIYIGVVGPVRTGKSTFIHRFLEQAVLPNIENEYDRTRTLDEMPQSASGRTVMTTEPKFIPDEAVEIHVGEDVRLRVKMVDCVGYMAEGALGSEEDGATRMVHTPWAREEIPFAEAAEIGTKKVIREHATIGVLMTTDGSICDLPREAYVHAEEQVAKELKEIGKPFCIILNAREPGAESARVLAEELEEKYGVPVALVSCLSLDARDIQEILSLILNEFPLKALSFRLPPWTMELGTEHPLYRAALETIDLFSSKVRKLGDIPKAVAENEGVEHVATYPGEGTAELALPVSKEVYFQTVSELCGIPIPDEGAMIRTLMELSAVKRAYEKIESALSDANEKGYGIVMPSPDELEFEEPKLVKTGSGWGVKMAARAKSIHMIKAGIQAELSPMVGTEEQAEEVIRYLMNEFEEDPKRVWACNMFGKSLYDLVSDGLNGKLSHMPDEAREKLGETLEKIINEGANGLICILL